MKILIAGSNGMVGSAVTRYLIECGHEVIRLVRQHPTLVKSGGILMPAKLTLLAWRASMASSILPLCPGLCVGRKKPNKRYAPIVWRPIVCWPSRWLGCEHKPQVLICASGMGYYPSSGESILTEEAPLERVFLPGFNRMARQPPPRQAKPGSGWYTCASHRSLGGAALQPVGFQAGDGQQWVSWVGRDEMASIIEFALKTES